MESERERLGRLYAEMGDEHLRDMAEEPEDLTDDARMALAAEMRRRGFAAAGNERPVVAEVEPEREQGFGAGIPGVIPTGAAAVEQALEPGGEERRGMARLLAFYDGVELSRACTLLDEAGMDFAIEEIAGDGMSGVPQHFEVWVNTDQQEAARSVLREKMGLFPVAEVDAGTVENDGVVGVFDTRGEAEEIRGMLVQAGFGARVEEGEGGVTVVVRPEEQERALGVVAERLGLG